MLWMERVVCVIERDINVKINIVIIIKEYKNIDLLLRYM